MAKRGPIYVARYDLTYVARRDLAYVAKHDPAHVARYDPTHVTRHDSTCDPSVAQFSVKAKLNSWVSFSSAYEARLSSYAIGIRHIVISLSSPLYLNPACYLGQACATYMAGPRLRWVDSVCASTIWHIPISSLFIDLNSLIDWIR